MTVRSGTEMTAVRAPGRADVGWTQRRMARLPGPDLWWAQRNSPEPPMFKFLGKTAGIIFLIGLAVVIGLLMLIF